MTAEQRLLHAVKHGDFQLAKQAVDDGADFHNVRDKNKPLLRIAAESGKRRICEWLVTIGADVNETQGARNYSLLHSAVASSDYGLASILLDLGANPSPKSSNAATPLHIAARTSQGFLTKNLIQHGAEIDASDDNGRTPLHWAVEKGDTSMAKLLIKHGCDVNPLDRKHRTPLAIALAHGQGEIEELLVQNGATASSSAEHSWSQLTKSNEQTSPRTR